MDVPTHYVEPSTSDGAVRVLVWLTVFLFVLSIGYGLARPARIATAVTAVAIVFSASSTVGIGLSIRDFARFPQDAISYGVGENSGWFFTQRDLDAASLKNYGVTLHGVRFFGVANGSIVQATARDDKGVAIPVVIRVHDPVTREGVRMTVFVQDAGRELAKVDDDSKTRGQDTVDKS